MGQFPSLPSQCLLFLYFALKFSLPNIHQTTSNSPVHHRQKCAFGAIPTAGVAIAQIARQSEDDW
ncbi:MAG: hypothetical protein RMX68_016025 [Aulosira sp. ZfuVER01]|nr:hypothetical protein [Aulosira sp. ZfuVER01]MDZ8002315.1 hypothetical protein [Aulosira sp. DedVER01a]MDZ8052681.1 hypothetical protein [Aulosira sp. ZfuCHP01]